MKIDNSTIESALFFTIWIVTEGLLLTVTAAGIYRPWLVGVKLGVLPEEETPKVSNRLLW